jgi:hypothetical protein
MPKYTKYDFNSDDPNWKLAVNYLRGEMPLQTDLGESFGYKGFNRSPIGNLFRAYRRIDPPGRKTLMFAKLDGSGKSDPTRQKNWSFKYYEEGDTSYQDEKIWLDEIDKAELKETQSTFDISNPLGSNDPTIAARVIRGGINVLPQEEKYPGKKMMKRSMHLDIEKVVNEKPFILTLIDYYPDVDLSVPIIFEPSGAIGKFNVYLNNAHPMFRDFADGYEDLIYFEVAARYSLMKNNNDWPPTRIYYELKSKYAPESMLSVPNLVTKASELMRDIQNRLIAGEGITLPRLPNLSDGEKAMINQKYLDLERKIIPSMTGFLLNTRYLKYTDLNYLFRFIEEFPEVIFDGKVLNLPYGELPEPSKSIQLKKYTGYFNDLRWFINDLAKEGDEAIKKLKSEIIRNRFSIEILYGSVNR